MKKEIVIIGYGRFGKLAAHHLKNYFQVSVYDTDLRLKLEQGLKRCTIDDLILKDVVILAVPISILSSVLVNISHKLKHNSLVVDVCSVKEQSIKWMIKYLPKDSSILGTHPLFGPDSARNTLKGKNIIICPERISESNLHKILNFLSSFGLTVTKMTAKEHDKLMASTLFLTQFIGRGLIHLNVEHTLPRTEIFKLIEKVIRFSNNDSFELFFDIYRYNRYTKRIPDKIIRNLMDFKKAIESKQLENSER